MKPKITYRWGQSGILGVAALHENGSIRCYTRESIEAALKVETEADRPPHICGFKFEKNRQNQINKFRAGLALLDGQPE